MKYVVIEIPYPKMRSKPLIIYRNPIVVLNKTLPTILVKVVYMDLFLLARNILVTTIILKLTTIILGLHFVT